MSGFKQAPRKGNRAALSDWREIRAEDLTARMEPFDSFWEAPDDVERGYGKFSAFYRANYLSRLPATRDARILVIGCGPGYLVQLLVDSGYTHVVGIDSFPEKIDWATDRGLPCRTAPVFEFLQTSDQQYDAIVGETEINHLTKDEILLFLDAVRDNLVPGGIFLTHSINATSPLTGSESRSGNWDHYCSFTEYSLRQVLEYAGFKDVEVFGLNLYVFWKNPLNYVAWAIDRLNTVFFRLQFILVGKSARVFTKKIGAACRRAG